jgi:peptide subunit release factor 1 (eRF1)
VVAISEDAIRTLAAFKGEGAPVTSCYLDVDGRRHRSLQDVEHELSCLLRDARSRANGTVSVHHDLERIEAYVRNGIDRSRTRGLAFFACSTRDLFQVVPLPVPVRNEVTINAFPAVGQLELVIESAEPLGVLLVDRQHTRMFVFELGELVEHTEEHDELPRDVDVRGEKERGDTASHVSELAQQHVRRAADAAFRAFQQRPFAHLCIGVPDELSTALEGALHPYLRDRLRGRIAVTPTAHVDDVRRAAIEIEAQQQRAREAELVGRMRAEVGAGGKGSAGLEGTLSALSDHRVDVLLVSDGYRAEGWRCDGCGRLAAIGRICKSCGAEMESVDNVVEEAVDLALANSARVEMCDGNPDLDVHGRIGALLRY